MTILRSLAALLCLLPTLAMAGGALPPFGSQTPYLGRTLQSRAQEVVNVLDAPYNAKCDGTTDDTAAFNAATAVLRANYVSGMQMGIFKLPGGRTCVLKGTWNRTGFGFGLIRFELTGSLIVSKAGGLPAIDDLGSRHMHNEGLNLRGDCTTPPSIGWQFGRKDTTANNSADYNSISFGNIDGCFTKAATLILNSEVFSAHHTNFDNDIQNTSGAYVLVLDGLNHFNTTSAFVTQNQPVDVPQSFNEATFNNVSVRSSGSAIPIWAGNLSRLKFDRSYVEATVAGGPEIVVYFGANAYNVLWDLDIHSEDHPSNVFLLTGLANPIWYGLKYQDQHPFATGSIFKMDSGVSTVTIQDADLKIASFENGATWFDTPSAYTIGGLLWSQTSTGYTAPGTFTGRSCFGAVCTNTIVLPSTLSVSAINNPGGVAGITITNNGNLQNGETPTVTIAAPPSGGQQATAHVTFGMLGTPAIASGGTGYVVGDRLNLPGTCTTNPIVTVTSVGTGGVVTGWSYYYVGLGCIGMIPSTGSPMSGGTGTGATLGTESWKVLTAVVDSAGAGYNTAPTATFSAAQGASFRPAGTTSLNSLLTISAGQGSITADSGGTHIQGGGADVFVASTSLGTFKAPVADGTAVRVGLSSSGYTVPSSTSLVRFTQQAAVTATITLSTALGDGQVIQFVNQGTGNTSGAITATFSPPVQGFTNGGTIPASSGFRIRWDAVAAVWQREQ